VNLLPCNAVCVGKYLVRWGSNWIYTALVDDRNTRAAQRIDDLGLGGFPTTFFDAGYGEVVGGYPDTNTYINQIITAGERTVPTDILDLTVSMNWLDGQGSPDDDIEITVTISVRHDISFTYPDGVPEVINPEEETIFGVNVAGIGLGIPVSGTGQLHYSIDGGPYMAIDMVEILPDEYEAALPPISCNEIIDYYFSVDEQNEGTLYDHDLSPFHSISLNVFDTVFFDDFESDLGWTVSGGQWARGLPTGEGGAYGYPDPIDGHSGSKVLGYNLSGDYANNIPEYHVTSPAIDCSGMENIELRFWRWLGVQEPTFDHAYIRISTDGSSWNTIWENGTIIEDNAWTEQVIDISSYADNQATVYIRFTMGTTNMGGTWCGWNIDDIALNSTNCVYNGLTISTETLPDWTIGHPFSQTLNCINQYGNVVWTDRYDDLTGTGLSLSTDGLTTGTPLYTGDISFVALVIDDTPDSTDRYFTITINPVVDITTTTLDDGTEGETYSYQLESIGGTGSIIWSDLNGDLNGTGLTLSALGLLSGSPSSDATISFTAVATDDVGANDQLPFSINISCCRLRGDVADPEDLIVLVNDIVWLVDYIFKGGVAPTCLDEGDCAIPLDGSILVNDIVWLVDYIFKGGTIPPDC